MFELFLCLPQRQYLISKFIILLLMFELFLCFPQRQYVISKSLILLLMFWN
jgi:hypothetical protein